MQTVLCLVLRRVDAVAITIVKQFHDINRDFYIWLVVIDRSPPSIDVFIRFLCS